MATISNNEIKIKYSLDTTDLANATALFDRLSAEDRQLLNDLKKLQAQLTATGQAGQTAGQNIGNGLNNARNKSKGLLDDFIQMQNPIKQIGTLIVTAFSVQSLVRFGRTVLDTTIKMESLRKAIEFTSGSVTAGLVNFQFLEKVAKDLGLPLEAAAEGFKGFSAAAQRAGITMENQQKMFVDLSKAMAALQVTSQDAQLIFFGFSQLMSKAKVSAQELYHQIGERLPLAMEAAQIAAGRMTGQTKVTTSELMKMVEGGKLLSEKFAPEFTKALGELAGDAAYVETLGKSFTRLGNAWTEMLDEMGQSNKGWFKETLDGFANFFSSVRDYFKGFQKSIEFEQTSAFENAIKKSQQMTTESIEFRLDILEKQKEVAQKEVDAIQKNMDALEGQRKMITIDGKDFLGITPEGYEETKKNLEQAQLKLANLQGTVDGFIKTLKERKPIITKEELDDTKEAEKLYKILIAREESRMKAEEDLIRSRTRPGTEQDLLVVQNRIKFNNKMLDIDRDARFKELELAKNNAVKRDAEIVKDEESIEETKRQVRFKAFAAEKEYLDKNLELIQDAQRKRRQAIQTDEQNELEDTKDFYDDKEKVLTDAYKKNIAVQGLSNDTLKTLEQNYNDAILELTEDREKARLDIIDKYRAIEKRQRIEAEAEIRSTLVEAATIRNAALEKNEMRKADIADEGALAQIEIERKKNHDIAAEELKSGNLSEENKKIINEKLHAMDVLLDAQATEIVQNGEKRRLEYKTEIGLQAVELARTITEGIFSYYQQQLDNDLTANQKKYDEEIRLAEGNKQRITQIEAKRAEAEKEIRRKQFEAQRMQAIAQVIFNTAPLIAQYLAGVLTGPLAAIALAAQATQIGFIMAQPVPEFAEGTKGRKFKGGPAIVGERGVEKVITESGKVYYTPERASLVELPKGSQVIPNHALTKQELFVASQFAGRTTTSTASPVVGEIRELGSILKGLPITQLNMDERGFEKYIRTPRRSTKILNNRFGINN